MPIKVIRKSKNVVKQIPVIPTIELPQQPISKIYPFIVYKQITSRTSFFNKGGTLTIPIDTNKPVNGNLFIQATVPFSSTYSVLELDLVVKIFSNTTATTILTNNFFITKDFLSTDFIKYPINIGSDIVGTNNKLGLIIRARNIGPGSGSTNIIDLAYFEKNS